MELFNESAWYVEMLFNVCMVLIPTLAALAIIHPLGKRAALVFISVWKFARQFFDERTDPAIVALSDATGYDSAIVVSTILTNIDGIAGVLKSELDKLEAKPKAE